MHNNSIIDDLKWQFRHGNIISRLVLINIIVFLFFSICKIFFFFTESVPLFKQIMNWLYLPANPLKLIQRPWTFFTYQFLHQGFLHILFNMLWLYWLGRILVNYTSERRIWFIYLFGGIVGGLAYVLAYNTFPVFTSITKEPFLLGASASVMAIVLATATLLPEYEIRLFFLGFIKLKYLALAAVLLDIITIDGGNPGGHIAHLGGAFFGWLFMSRFKKGKDLSSGYYQIIDWCKEKLSKNPKPKVAYINEEKINERYSKTNASIEKDRQAAIDAILDKIGEGGYDSLSAEEKEFLFRISKEDEVT